MILPIPFESADTFHSLDVWALLLVIIFFIFYFIYATKIFPRRRFKFIRQSKDKKSIFEMHYAMYKKDGFKVQGKSPFIVHAFKSEESRNEFLRTLNSSHRKRYDENNTYAVAVTKDDSYVKQAIDDVKMNPLVYNNLDYVNQRIYIEHDK